MKIHKQLANIQTRHPNQKIIFSLVVILFVFAIKLFNPQEVKAADTQWITDAGGTHYVYIPGSLYWAGSNTRTGLLIYCVDTNTGAVVRNSCKVLYNNKIDDNGDYWINMVNVFGKPRIGEGNLCTSATYCSILPTTGQFSNADGSSDIKAWMEADSGAADSSGTRMCNAALLVYRYLPTHYAKVKNKQYTFCFEGMYGMARYQTINGKSVAESYNQQVAAMLYPPDRYSTEERAKLSIIKYFYPLHLFIKTQNAYGVNIASQGSTKNYKWIQGCAQYFKIEQPHFGVPAARKSGADVTNSEALNTGWNFGVVIAANNPIHTYYAPNGTPGAPEPPSSTKNTDGPCTIKKLYYVENYDSDHNLLSTEYHGPYQQQNTTNEIVIDAEAGYTIEKYKTSTQDRPLTSKEEFNDIPAVCSRHTGRGSTTITIQECSTDEKYLYVLYKKEIIAPEPPEPYQFRLSIHW